MTMPDKAQSLPSVRELLRQLRAGEVVCSHGHTLVLALDMGPFVLHGTSPDGDSYYGSVTRRYVQWWRTRVLAGQDIIEPVPSLDVAEPAVKSTGAEINSWIDQLFNQMDLTEQPSQPALVPPLLGPWAQRVIATQLVELLDDNRFNIWQVDRLGRAFESILSRMDRAWCEPKDHPDYAALKVLHFSSYQTMELRVAAGLPDAVLQVLGLDHALLQELLGDCAGMVIERFARGVVPPEPAPEPTLEAELVAVVEVETPTPRIAPDSFTRPVSGWRRFFGVRSTTASRAG